jgi:CRISPR-associated protein Csm4
MLLATCARVHGPAVLRDRLIEPMLVGQPPFVLSDACPGDLLPMPIWLRLASWSANTDRKLLKRTRWLSPQAFLAARNGKIPPPDQLFPDDALFIQTARHHNTLSRLTDTTGDADEGLAPFQRPETLMRSAVPHSRDCLSVYFRLLQPDAADLLLDLMHELSLTGYGADVATGRGQFEILDDPQTMPDLEAPLQTGGTANAVVCLSTFQPGPNDPTDGLWEAFPKFGKLGPDLGLADVRKNTLILFRPGSCFRVAEPRSHLGRAIPMQELLPADTASKLPGVNIIHPAFGLALAIHMD